MLPYTVLVGAGGRIMDNAKGGYQIDNLGHFEQSAETYDLNFNACFL